MAFCRKIEEKRKKKAKDYAAATLILWGWVVDGVLPSEQRLGVTDRKRPVCERGAFCCVLGEKN